MNDVLIIIPAFNEEGNIRQVVDRLISDYSQYDYIIINDGSTDNTSKLCHANNYNIIDLPVNLGLAGAFQTGMMYASRKGYRYAVQFDGDGQHEACYIEAMKKRAEVGYDIVIASRFAERKKPVSMRMLGSNIISLVIFFTTGTRIKDPTSGMRMYNKPLIDEFAYRLNYAPEPDTVSYLIKQGARVSEVQAHMNERLSGVSYLTPVNAVRYMLRMVISILFIQNFRRRQTCH